MGKLKNILIILLTLLFFAPKGNCATVWINDLRSLFQSNGAIIYAVNIRTFNAKDKNNNGIIDEEMGEESGNFLNATGRLDELAACGVNTILLLPVTPVGKVKALGTAGSLFAPSSFNEINPQLKSPNENLTIYDEMKQFIDECHKRKIRVIVDLPCCGSYDLYLKKPELFLKDKNQNPIIPADWTDVRILDAGTNEQINTDVYNLYRDFVNLMVSLDVDGIRADVPTIKPFKFWQKLIEYTRARNPQFLFLAEASPLWKKAPCEGTTFTPYDKLLDAGFDGYYGTYSDLKNWKTSKELMANVKLNIDLAKKYSNTKSVIGNFATHDTISPILINGNTFSKMIIWLNATLPLNSYYVDGFSTGDDYLYQLANKKASKTYTDDEYYFMHRGQLDIFNFSRRPEGKYYDIFQDFVMANRFKIIANKIITNGNFVPLKTSSTSVFAYSRNFDTEFIVVIGNLDFKKTQDITVSASKINSDLISAPIKISNIPEISKGKITTTLAPGEVQVLYFKSQESK